MSQTIKVLVAAASLTMSWAFSSTDAAILRLQLGAATNSSPSGFDMSAPVPVPAAFLPPLLWPETHTSPSTFFAEPTLAPLVFLTGPLRPKANASQNSVEPPSAARLTLLTPPVRSETSVSQIASDMPSPSPAAFASLPRQRETNVDRLRFDTPSLAPMAFVRFCMRYPRDCEIPRTESRPEPLMFNKGRKAELAQVNRDVNRAIRPQANVNGVTAEEWLISPRVGDCNDYAVTKRHELLARGWPSHSLLLAEVAIPSGEHHLVLVVRTREDDIILDNLNWNIRSVSQTHYRWVRAQQASNPRFWATVTVTRATRVAMGNVR